MFNAGLSQQLIYALHSISKCSPEHQTQIEERLLEELSICLSGQPNAYAIVEKTAIHQESNPYQVRRGKCCSLLHPSSTNATPFLDSLHARRSPPNRSPQPSWLQLQPART